MLSDVPRQASEADACQSLVKLGGVDARYYRKAAYRNCSEIARGFLCARSRKLLTR